MLILLRGLPGAIDFEKFSKVFCVDHIVSPWNFVEKEEVVVNQKKIQVFSGDSWKDAHNKCRTFIHKHLYAKESILVWFEFDKFYHLLEYKEIAMSLSSEFIVLDVFDNGFSNFELVENCKNNEIYQNAVTNKYILQKKSRWHFTWQRQK